MTNNGIKKQFSNRPIYILQILKSDCPLIREENKKTKNLCLRKTTVCFCFLVILKFFFKKIINKFQ